MLFFIILIIVCLDLKLWRIVVCRVNCTWWKVRGNGLSAHFWPRAFELLVSPAVPSDKRFLLFILSWIKRLPPFPKGDIYKSQKLCLCSHIQQKYCIYYGEAKINRCLGYFRLWSNFCPSLISLGAVPCLPHTHLLPLVQLFSWTHRWSDSNMSQDSLGQ